MVSRYPWILLTGVFNSWAIFWVSWRLSLTCSSSWVTSLMEISKLASWKMIHSTINVRPFLLMVTDIRFSPFPLERSCWFLLIKWIISFSSLMAKTSSVVSRLESEIRLLYWVKRLLTRISFLSFVNIPSPSCEIWRWVISFSRSM